MTRLRQEVKWERERGTGLGKVHKLGLEHAHKVIGTNYNTILMF